MINYSATYITNEMENFPATQQVQNPNNITLDDVLDFIEYGLGLDSPYILGQNYIGVYDGQDVDYFYFNQDSQELYDGNFGMDEVLDNIALDHPELNATEILDPQTYSDYELEAVKEIFTSQM